MPAEQRYHHGDLRNALLDAVEAIIIDEGLAAVSLRAAARRVGVSHAAPAHHFGDKTGLLSAFAARGHERFTAAMQQSRDAHQDRPLEERMRALGATYLNYAMQDRACYEVMFRHELIDSESAEVREKADGAFRLLLEQVAEGVGADDPEQPDVVRIALGTWSLVHGAVSLWQMGGPQSMCEGLTLDDMTALVCDMAWTAMSGDPAWSARGASTVS